MDRKQFEKWFKTTDAYKLLEEQNYFKVDLLTFKEHRNQYQHTSVQIAYMTWQHQQAKVDELQKQLSEYIFVSETLDEMYVKEAQKSDELQEEFAEDERFLKEQIKDKDLKISNLEYQQGMDKELIQTLQSKSEKLQKQFDQHDKLLLQRNKDVEELYDINEKHAAEKAELQKRVDAALKKLDKRRDELWSKWKWQADMQDQGAANAFEEAYWILEQAIKGEG